MLCFVGQGSRRDITLPPQLALDSVRAFEENYTSHPMAREATLGRMVTWVKQYWQGEGKDAATSELTQERRGWQWWQLGNASCKRGDRPWAPCPIRESGGASGGGAQEFRAEQGILPPACHSQDAPGPSQGRANYLPPLVPTGNQAGNEQRRAPAHVALCWLGKPTIPRPRLGSGAEMWNFPGKHQNHH